MLFNTCEFIFGYLPIVLALFFLLARSSHRFAASWLTVASLVFYGWWNPRYVLLLLASTVFNYIAGFWLGKLTTTGRRSAQGALVLAVSVNLAVLAVFKYANFFSGTVNDIVGSPVMPVLNIVLPAGISFFTFTQIAYLVDVRRGIVREYDFVHYLLFVTYFPHLIAGPVLHHKEMMPQFANPATYRLDWDKFGWGGALFILGLAKKVVLADSAAEFVKPGFGIAEAGGEPLFVVSWISALAYTFQLYFDFSGYTDMALGLSAMFGVQLPINFNSPYKASSIIEFWKRWHMTLSRFLRDYLYIPLGGNRCGMIRRHANLMITMLLGGLWHGANWTFVIWGGLHGIFLVINHMFRSLIGDSYRPSPAMKIAGTVLTFVLVVVAWVFFRSETFHAAQSMLAGMFGFHGLTTGFAGQLVVKSELQMAALFAVCGGLVFGSPNSQELLNQLKISRRFSPGPWLFAAGLLLGVCLITMGHTESVFLYFQF